MKSTNNIVTVFLFISTGVAFDCSETCNDEKCAIKMIKQRGKVAKLEEELQSKLMVDLEGIRGVHSNQII